MKLKFFVLLLIPALVPLFAEPLYSPAWGFRLDLPEGYVLSGGNGRDRFSFAGPDGAQFELAAYAGTYKTLKNLVDDASRRLRSQGDVTYFEYGDKLAALLELRFGDSAGWGLCVELAAPAGGDNAPANKNLPMLLALSYGPAGKKDMDLFHMSALDSIAPSEAERRCPGPIMEFGYPRGELQETALALPGVRALIRKNDAEAAQALVDREFALLRKYLSADNWQEAWARFYRTVYRDSWDRLADAVFQLERNWSVSVGNAARNAGAAGRGPVSANETDRSLAETAQAERALAEKALAWVQTFKYERDLMGSDFVNLVSAVTEGRGDCDSRAMLWALILAQADIPAAIMVSREHSHAMGLANIAGTGARFEAKGTKWLVAETTANVSLGLIGQNVSNIDSWLGVIFE